MHLWSHAPKMARCVTDVVRQIQATAAIDAIVASYAAEDARRFIAR
jgi:hypothetical protein